MKNYKWIAFFAVALSLFVNVASMGAIIISLKEISLSFGTSIHEVSWLVIIHLLTVTLYCCQQVILQTDSVKKKFIW